MLNFKKNKAQRIIIKIIGNKEIEIFLIIESEINLIVVSEKIIKKTPNKNVMIFNLEYLEFSFDKVITKRGVNDNTNI